MTIMQEARPTANFVQLWFPSTRGLPGPLDSSDSFERPDPPGFLGLHQFLDFGFPGLFGVWGPLGPPGYFDSIDSLDLLGSQDARGALVSLGSLDSLDCPRRGRPWRGCCPRGGGSQRGGGPVCGVWVERDYPSPGTVCPAWTIDEKLDRILESFNNVATRKDFEPAEIIMMKATMKLVAEELESWRTKISRESKGAILQAVDPLKRHRGHPVSHGELVSRFGWGSGGIFGTAGRADEIDGHRQFPAHIYRLPG